MVDPLIVTHFLIENFFKFFDWGNVVGFPWAEISHTLLLSTQYNPFVVHFLDQFSVNYHFGHPNDIPLNLSSEYWALDFIKPEFLQWNYSRIETSLGFVENVWVKLRNAFENYRKVSGWEKIFLWSLKKTLRGLGGLHICKKRTGTESSGKDLQK